MVSVEQKYLKIFIDTNMPKHFSLWRHVFHKDVIIFYWLWRPRGLGPGSDQIRSVRLGLASEAAGSEQPSGSQGPEILRIAAKIARRHSKVKLFEQHWFYGFLSSQCRPGGQGLPNATQGTKKRVSQN